MEVNVLRAAALLALVVSQGCAGYGRKRVNGKQAPLMLIARDGTTCSVSRKKFDSTRIGSNAWCTWRDQSR